MRTREFQKIWVEQCEAAQGIRLRYGPEAAFDYLVAEKLLNFADVATRRPEFAHELPRFVTAVRGLFTPEEMRTQIARVEREKMVDEAVLAEVAEDDEALFDEPPEEVAEHARQFALIKELLTAAALGTS